MKKLMTLGLLFAGSAAALAAPSAASAAASFEGETLAGLPVLWWLAPLASVLALMVAYNFYQKMISSNPGNKTMQEIAGYVREGAMAYLSRQYRIV